MDSDVLVSLVALVIAVLALLVTTTQTLAQVFSTAEGQVFLGAWEAMGFDINADIAVAKSL